MPAKILKLALVGSAFFQVVLRDRMVRSLAIGQASAWSRNTTCFGAVSTNAFWGITGRSRNSTSPRAVYVTGRGGQPPWPGAAPQTVCPRLYAPDWSTP